MPAARRSRRNHGVWLRKVEPATRDVIEQRFDDLGGLGVSCGECKRNAHSMFRKEDFDKRIGDRGQQARRRCLHRQASKGPNFSWKPISDAAALTTSRGSAEVDACDKRRQSACVGTFEFGQHTSWPQSASRTLDFGSGRRFCALKELHRLSSRDARCARRPANEGRGTSSPRHPLAATSANACASDVPTLA